MTSYQAANLATASTHQASAILGPMSAISRHEGKNGTAYPAVAYDSTDFMQLSISEAEIEYEEPLLSPSALSLHAQSSESSFEPLLNNTGSSISISISKFHVKPRLKIPDACQGPHYPTHRSKYGQWHEHKTIVSSNLVAREVNPIANGLFVVIALAFEG